VTAIRPSRVDLDDVPRAAAADLIGPAAFRVNDEPAVLLELVTLPAGQTRLQQLLGAFSRSLPHRRIIAVPFGDERSLAPVIGALLGGLFLRIDPIAPVELNRGRGRLRLVPRRDNGVGGGGDRRGLVPQR